jgi:hypothetical protein
MWDGSEMHTKFRSENPKEELGIEGRIILKLLLNT